MFLADQTFHWYELDRPYREQLIRLAQSQGNPMAAFAACGV